MLSFRFWFFKFAAATAITVGAFFIPEGAFTTGNAPFHSNIFFCLMEILAYPAAR